MISTSCRLAFILLLIGIFSACASPTVVPTQISPSVSAKKAHVETSTSAPQATAKINTPTRTGIDANKAALLNTSAPAPTRIAPTRAQTASTASANATPTPQATTTTTSDLALFPDQLKLQGPPFQAAVQNFENGFMLWRSDLNCVYAIRDWGNGDLRALNFSVHEKNHPSTPKIYGYCFRVEPLGNADAAVTAPAGKAGPNGAPGKVWHAYEGIRSTLGFATAPELGYTASYPPNGQITLPNGKTLACEFDYGALTTYCTQE